MKSRLLSDNKTVVEDPDDPGPENRIAQKVREVREALAVLQIRLDTLPNRKELRALHDDAEEVIRRAVALLEQLERA